MKVLLVNGSPHERGCTYTALCEVAGALNECGVETEIFWIGKEAVHGCTACGGCAKADRCVFGDDCCNALIEKMCAADGMVVGSPVYYAGPNGALCALLDRAFYVCAGQMANKPAASVVSCRRGGASAAFDRLNKYFTISRMPVVSSQYWNSVHGTRPEETRQDQEGLQVMRTLGRQMAYLMKSVRAADLPEPAREKRVSTNFIR